MEDRFAGEGDWPVSIVLLFSEFVTDEAGSRPCQKRRGELCAFAVVGEISNGDASPLNIFPCSVSLSMHRVGC